MKKKILLSTVMSVFALTELAFATKRCSEAEVPNEREEKRIRCPESRSQNPSLRERKIDGNSLNDKQLGQLIKKILEPNNISHLTVEDNAIGTETITFIANFLVKNSSLRSLDLGEPTLNLDKDDILTITKALHNNTNLKALGLGGDGWIWDENFVVFFESLKNNTSLRILKLIGTGIDWAGGESLAKYLDNNQHLTHIDISINSIGNTGISAIADALKNNNSLTHLIADNNDIENDELEIVAEMLLKNTSLKNISLRGAIHSELSFDENYFEDDSEYNVSKGVTAIAKALKENQSLEYIDLGDRIIGDKGCIALAKALEVNSTLTHLSLRDSYITESGVRALSKALETNKSLKVLDLCRINISNDLKSELISMMSNVKFYVDQDNEETFNINNFFNDPEFDG